MKAVTLQFPVHSFRRIETPFERDPGYKNYLAIVDIFDVPNLKDWRDINVRDAKIRGRVPEAIRESLTSRPDEFVFLNRGLVIAAEHVEMQESGKEKILRITFADPQLHGLLDGGHTYQIIQDTKPTLGADEPRRFVKIELLTGFDDIVQVVDARNTSNQVAQESLDNLDGQYDPLKNILAKQPYHNQIAWSEYEILPDGEAKPISVRDIIAFLACFDVEAFRGDKHPLIAYKDKRACLRHYRDNHERIQKYIKLLPEILLLWDDIHLNWFDWYKEGRADEAGKEGRPGGLTGINSKVVTTLHFRGAEAPGRIPESYKYPILAALRCAVETKGGSAGWITDPVKLLQSVGPRLVGAVGNAIRRELNPNKVGKDVAVWSNCYVIADADARIKKLEAELKALKSKR